MSIATYIIWAANIVFTILNGWFAWQGFLFNAWLGGMNMTLVVYMLFAQLQDNVINELMDLARSRPR